MPAKWVSYRHLAARTKTEFGYQPSVGRWDHWLSSRALAALKGIGGGISAERLCYAELGGFSAQGSPLGSQAEGIGTVAAFTRAAFNLALEA